VTDRRIDENGLSHAAVADAAPPMAIVGALSRSTRRRQSDPGAELHRAGDLHRLRAGRLAAVQWLGWPFIGRGELRRDTIYIFSDERSAREAIQLAKAK
jgi:hypothetical protein